MLLGADGKFFNLIVILLLFFDISQCFGINQGFLTFYSHLFFAEKKRVYLTYFVSCNDDIVFYHVIIPILPNIKPMKLNAL